MFRALLSFLFCTSFCSIVFSQTVKDFGSNPGRLEMFLHVPAKNDSTPKALVVAIHGCNQGAMNLERISGWSDLADRYGFFVIYPQQQFTNNVSNCFNFFRKEDIQKDQGETGSIKQMIDHARKTYAIDSGRIYVYGISSGAAMAVSMMVNYPGLFRYGAVLAGAAYGFTGSPLAGLRTMSDPEDRTDSALIAAVKDRLSDYSGPFPKLILYHGRKDGVVNFKNSIQLLRQWAGLLNSDTIADRTEVAFAGNKSITRKEYFCDSSPCMIFYDVEDLGHRLMVDPGNGERQGGKTGLFALDKDFWSTFYIARDMQLIPENDR